MFSNLVTIGIWNYLEGNTELPQLLRSRETELDFHFRRGTLWAIVGRVGGLENGGRKAGHCIDLIMA